MLNGGIIDIVKAQLFLNNKENVIASLLLLSVFEFSTGFLKEFVSLLKAYITQYMNDKFKNKFNNVVQKSLNNNVAEVYFYRNYKNNDRCDTADAILSRVLKIPSSQKIAVISNLEIIKNEGEFLIDNELYFKLLQLDYDDDGLKKLDFKLYSNTKTVCYIRDYIQNITEEYLILKKNNLGNKLYFFDQIVEQKKGMISSRTQFTKHLFQTNRTLDNIFHEKQDELRSRFNFFINNKDWYNERGIPYTFGLLLHGSPGTGKTSTIKAVANVGQRHIININLSGIKTKKQLKKLFYDERLEICENINNPNNIKEYIIPIDKRLYILEDIDAIDSDILLKRNSNEKLNTQVYNLNDELENKEEVGDLDLSSLLNIIDGTLETPGRILIITTNYPEKLDHALIRPGRIDMIIEFKKCNYQVIVDMLKSFYSNLTELQIKNIKNIPEYLWSPAEISQILFKNFNLPDKTIEDLTNLNPKAYFKFSYFETTGTNDRTTDVINDGTTDVINDRTDDRTTDVINDGTNDRTLTPEQDAMKNLQELHENKGMLCVPNPDEKIDYNDNGYAINLPQQPDYQMNENTTQHYMNYTTSGCLYANNVINEIIPEPQVIPEQPDLDLLKENSMNSTKMIVINKRSTK
jgi:DNA polymerase III delta prime subunit